MVISVPKPEDIGRIKDYLDNRDPASGEILEKLRQNGELDCGLCISASEDGEYKGFIAVCYVRTGDIPSAAAALWYAEHPDTAALMFRQAEARLRELGEVSWFFAFGGQEFFQQTLGWSWTAGSGFIPPALDESARNAWCCKIKDSSPSFMPVELPEAMGLGKPECSFRLHSRMNDSELERAMLTTRERRRFGERTALILFIVLACVIGIWKREYMAVPVVAMALLALYQNIERPKRFVQKTMEALRASGKNYADDRLWFSDKAYLVYNGRTAQIASYSSIQTVYIKKEHIFLCYSSGTGHASGNYIAMSALEDNETFIGFLKEKMPQATFKK
ncbi:MAG: hypothetical protein IJ561_05095 [Ruminococcus sp.]|nr:hypothetical protein [Ruminococcus sp.]